MAFKKRRLKVCQEYFDNQFSIGERVDNNLVRRIVLQQIANLSTMKK